MRCGRLLTLFFLLGPTTGCFVGYGIQNSVSSPLDAVQECLFRYRMRQLARDAWAKAPKEPGKCYSADYVRGFEDGFVDYVDAGGNGEPPAAPPPHRRRGLLRSDDGPDRIEDWYDGFRQGAYVARAAGRRELAILPVALAPLTPTEPYPAQVIVPAPVVAPAPITFPNQVPVPIPAPIVVPGQAAVPAPEQPPRIFTGREPTPAQPSLGFTVREQ